LNKSLNFMKFRLILLNLVFLKINLLSRKYKFIIPMEYILNRLLFRAEDYKYRRTIVYTGGKGLLNVIVKNKGAFLRITWPRQQGNLHGLK